MICSTQYFLLDDEIGDFASILNSSLISHLLYLFLGMKLETEGDKTAFILFESIKE